MVPSEEVTVVIGHSCILFREGIARILDDGGFKVIGHADNLNDLRDLYFKLNPDIILLDVGVAGYCSDAIRELDNKSSVVVVTTTPDMSNQAVEAIRSGARGYLSVNQPSRAFIQELHIIARGDIIVSKEATNTLKECFS